MKSCPECKNVNIIVVGNDYWCRNCNWTSSPKRNPPRLAPKDKK